MKMKVLITLIALGMASTAVQAEMAFSISFGTYYYTPRHCYAQPVVCEPAPVVCAPAPIVCNPAPVVYYTPQIVYTAPVCAPRTVYCAPAPVCHTAPVCYTPRSDAGCGTSFGVGFTHKSFVPQSRVAVYQQSRWASPQAGYSGRWHH